MKKITKALLAGIVAGVLFLGSSAVAQTGDSMDKKLTIVFVHGLWADGSCWSKLINPLTDVELASTLASTNRLRQDSTKMEYPRSRGTSLEDDVAATKRAIDRADGDVVLDV